MTYIYDLTHFIKFDENDQNVRIIRATESGEMLNVTFNIVDPVACWYSGGQSILNISPIRGSTETRQVTGLEYTPWRRSAQQGRHLPIPPESSMLHGRALPVPLANQTQKSTPTAPGDDPKPL